MREIPVDATRFSEMVVMFVDVVPVLDQDKASATYGQQKTNKDNVPTWEIQLLTKEPGEVARKPEVTAVKTWSHVQPALNIGDRIEFVNLTGFVWSGDNGGGVSLRCDEAKAVGPSSSKTTKEKAAA